MCFVAKKTHFYLEVSKIIHIFAAYNNKVNKSKTSSESKTEV